MCRGQDFVKLFHGKCTQVVLQAFLGMERRPQFFKMLNQVQLDKLSEGFVVWFQHF